MRLTLNVNYNKSEGLVLSPSDLIQQYLHGIPLCYSDGRQLDYSTITQKLKSVQKQIESLLSIKLQKQIVQENHDFSREEFKQWGFVKAIFPVNEAYKLEGTINNITQVNYPKDWLSVKRTTDTTVHRNVYLIPNTSGGAVMTQNSFIFSGITPHLGFFGANYIPNYWRLTYCTGWDVVPDDILDAIGKLTAIQILGILGDVLLGIGITSSSISLDGLSQSLTNTKGSGGLFGSRIKQYSEELARELPNLRYEYKGITFGVL